MYSICFRLEARGQKRRAVIHRAAGIGHGIDGDKARQILRLGAEAVNDPCAHRGPHKGLAADVQRHGGHLMRVGACLHAVEDAEVIGVLRKLRKRVRNHETALAARFEVERSAHVFCQLLLVGLHELWFVIKRVQMARSALHEHEDHAFRLCREVRGLQCERIDSLRRCRSRSPLLMQRIEHQPAEACAGGLEDGAARDHNVVFGLITEFTKQHRGSEF
jgi:hypothetical protein